MTRANGYFEAYVNLHSSTIGEADRAFIARLNELVPETLPGARVRWAGSQRKSTAIEGSDLDVCIEHEVPVTEKQRKQLRAALERALARPAVVLSHAIRLPATNDAPRTDIAFANAAFGSRPPPDVKLFHDHRPRQLAARAVKLWTRAPGLPPVAGWVVEALVVYLDAGEERLPLELFQRVVEWIEHRATPSSIESVLRPAAFPAWNEAWSRKLPGRLTALQNHARALGKRRPAPEDWTSSDDVGRWLGR